MIAEFIDNDGNLIYLNYQTWKDIEAICKDIHGKMIDDEYMPDVIIGLSRGGIVPSRLLLDLFGSKTSFLSLDVKFYRSIGNTETDPIISSAIDFGAINNKKALIVDDIFDTGRTMDYVLSYLGTSKSTKTATLFLKDIDRGEKNYVPDWYGKKAEKREWIVFPWETHETDVNLSTIRKAH